MLLVASEDPPQNAWLCYQAGRSTSEHAELWADRGEGALEMNAETRPLDSVYRFWG